MKNFAFKCSAIATAALLGACGGGGGDSTSPTNVAPSTEAALTAATAFLARYDAFMAVPTTTGAAVFANHDGCFMSNGRSKAYSVADFDADPTSVANRADEIGSVRSNVTVLADRAITNADGSSRREIDIKYDNTYKDGSKYQSPADGVPDQTIISGSSAGSKLADGSTCATTESKSDWRFYGNRKVVNTYVNAINERVEGTILATGLAASPQVLYSKSIGLRVQDPAKVATYATITGPGLGVDASGNGTAGTLKLLSVRVLRDAPELAGKRGHFVDWRDADSFRFCRTAATGATASADTVDCTQGASGSNWGWFNASSGSALDTNFATLNIPAGAVYTFKVYGDDGWKTVNGQSTKTPIATYTETLRALPFSATTLAGTGVSTDRFARISSSSKTSIELATAFRNKTAISSDVVWQAPGAMPDGRAVWLSSTWVYQEGRATTTGASWPRSKSVTSSYPGAKATSMTLNIPAPVAALVLPTYEEIGIEYGNRNGNWITSYYNFQ